MPVIFSVNGIAFDKELKRSLSSKNSQKTILNNLKLRNGELVYKKIEKLKREMIADFLRLPVTKEILAGSTSSNISGTLGGYGNLFTFIGFNEGDRPINPIVQLLSQTNYKVTRFDQNGAAKLTIEIPSKQDIFGVTPLPWASGISWAERIEKGMSGLGMYLNTSSKNSRSGRGIQADNKIRTGKFSNTSYVSVFLNKWVKVFEKIDRDISVGRGL
jgi:hypothetical protein